MQSCKHEVLIVEDDPLWACALEKLVGEVLQARLIYVAASLADANRAFARHPFSLVLLDIRLPDGSGLSMVKEEKEPSCRFIIITARQDDFLLYLAHKCRVHSVIWKSSTVSVAIPTAIRAVVNGGVFFPVEYKERLEMLRRNPNAFYKILSDREMELLPHLAAGRSDREIAEQFAVSELTVKSHRSHIMQKIGVHRTPDLMRWAIEVGFSW